MLVYVCCSHLVINIQLAVCYLLSTVYCCNRWIDIAAVTAVTTVITVTTVTTTVGSVNTAVAITHEDFVAVT